MLPVGFEFNPYITTICQPSNSSQDLCAPPLLVCVRWCCVVVRKLVRCDRTSGEEIVTCSMCKCVCVRFCVAMMCVCAVRKCLVLKPVL
jgi:hypothetical protein